MKAILIDAVNQKISEVALNPNKPMLDQFYQLLNVDLVEVGHYIDHHDSIMVDEEGLINGTDVFFYYDGAHQPFAGSGLITGVDNEGETVDCNISYIDVVKATTFLTREEILNNGKYFE